MDYTGLEIFFILSGFGVMVGTGLGLAMGIPVVCAGIATWLAERKGEKRNIDIQI